MLSITSSVGLKNIHSIFQGSWTPSPEGVSGKSLGRIAVDSGCIIKKPEQKYIMCKTSARLFVYLKAYFFASIKEDKGIGREKFTPIIPRTSKT